MSGSDTVWSAASSPSAACSPIRGLLPVRGRRIDRLLHVGHVDGHGGVGGLAPVARAHREFEPGRAGLEVLARALVEELAARLVDLERARLVAAGEAVDRRRALGVGRGDGAERHPVGAAVGVLREVEGVARLGEGGRLVHVGDVDGDGGVGTLAPVARAHGESELSRAGFEVFARALVEELAAGGVDVERVRLVAAGEAVGQRRALGVGRRDGAERDPVGAPVGVLREVEGVARLGEGGRLVHVGDVDGDGGVGTLAPVARAHRQGEARGAGLEVLARALVEELAAGGVDLERARLVAAHQAVGEGRALGVGRRERAERHPVRAAVRVLREVEGVARLGEGGRLVHVGDVDGDGGVGGLAPVARAHGQGEASGGGLEVLARALVEELPARLVDLERARFVAADQAVGQ